VLRFDLARIAEKAFEDDQRLYTSARISKTAPRLHRPSPILPNTGVPGENLERIYRCIAIVSCMPSGLGSDHGEGYPGDLRSALRSRVCPKNSNQSLLAWFISAHPRCRTTKCKSLAAHSPLLLFHTGSTAPIRPCAPTAFLRPAHPHRVQLRPQTCLATKRRSGRKRNRERFACRRAAVLNVLSAPGSGKNRAAEQLARQWRPAPVGVIVGDLPPTTTPFVARPPGARAVQGSQTSVILSSGRRGWWGGPLINSSPRA